MILTCKYALAVLLSPLSIVGNNANNFKSTSPFECRIEAIFPKKNEIRRATATLIFRVTTTRTQEAVHLGLAGVKVLSAEFEGRFERPDLIPSLGGVTLRLKDAGEYRLIVEVEPSFEVRNGGIDRRWTFPLHSSEITTFCAAARQESPGKLINTSLIPTHSSVVKRLSSTAYTSPLDKGAVARLECTWQAAPVAPLRDRIDSQIEVSASDTAIFETHRLVVVTTRRQLDISLPKDSKITLDPQDARRDAVKFSFVSPSVVRVELPESGNWSFLVSKKVSSTVSSLGEINSCRIQGIDTHLGRIRLVSEPTLRIEPSGLERVQIIEEHDPITGKIERYFAFAATDDQSVLNYRINRRLGSIRSRPTHLLALFEQQWQWRASYRLTPRNREVLELELKVPIGWSTVRIGPDDSIDEITTSEQADGSRQLTIRMVNSTKEPFELTMDASFPAGPGKEWLLTLPSLKNVLESDGRVIVSVPEPSVATCVVRSNNQDVLPVYDGTSSLEPKSRTSVISNLPIEAIRIIGSVDRPALQARITTETVLYDRQAVIQQTINLKADKPYPRPIRLAIPVEAAGLRVQPIPMTVQGSTAYVVWPALETEFTITLSYALPRPGDVSLVWPEDATDTMATIHAWGAPGTRLRAPLKGWKIEPISAVSNRSTYPWLSITTTRSPDTPAPIWQPNEYPAEVDDSPDVTIDAAIVAVWPHENRRYRMRCLVGMKNTSGFDVSLPDPEEVEIWIDGRRLESPIPTAIQPRIGFLTTRISWPESRQASPMVIEFRGHRNLPIIERARLLEPVRWVFAQDLKSWVLPFDPMLFSASRWCFNDGRFTLTDNGSDVRLVPGDSDWPRSNDEPTATAIQLDRWPSFVAIDRWYAVVPSTLFPIGVVFWGYRSNRKVIKKMFIVCSLCFAIIAVIIPFTLIQVIQLCQYGIYLSVCVILYLMYISKFDKKLRFC